MWCGCVTPVISVDGKESVPIPGACSVPQSSVLGPVQFISYSEDVVIVFNAHHHVLYHIFAADKQLFASAPVGQEDDGAVRCCHQGLCVSSAKTKWRKDGSHLARHPPSSSASCRRRSQLVSWKWHHQTINCRTWPGCVRRRRADIPRACSTYHQQLLLSTSPCPPNSEAHQPPSHEAVGARICHQ